MRLPCSAPPQNKVKGFICRPEGEAVAKIFLLSARSPVITWLHTPRPIRLCLGASGPADQSLAGATHGRCRGQPRAVPCQAPGWAPPARWRGLLQAAPAARGWIHAEAMPSPARSQDAAHTPNCPAPAPTRAVDVPSAAPKPVPAAASAPAPSSRAVNRSQWLPEQSLSPSPSPRLQAHLPPSRPTQTRVRDRRAVTCDGRG